MREGKDFIYISFFGFINDPITHEFEFTPCRILIGIWGYIGNATGEKAGKSKEEIIMEDIKRIAKENQLRNFQIPISIYIDEKLDRWTSEKGLLTGSNKLCRRNLKAHYSNEISNLYLQSIMNSIFDSDSIDSSKTFQELGGTSIAAIQIIEKLNKSSINLTFEELMGSKSIKELLNDKQAQENNKFRELPKFVKENDNKNFSANEEIQNLNQFLIEKNLSTPIENDNYKKFSEKYRNPRKIFLTGGSGFVGAELINCLLLKYPLSELYCLCRSESSIKSDSVRVKRMKGDLSQPLFGLSVENYQFLQSEIDLIVHAGAVVNHLINLKDLYNTNVSSIYQIIDLSLSDFNKKQEDSENNESNEVFIKPIHYVSSVSALMKKPTTERGYGSSKWIVDKLLQVLKEKYNLPIFIYRPSLIIGNRENGRINKKDWFHRLLASFIDFNILPPAPNASVPINMIPLDYCVSVILTVLSRFPPGCGEQEYQFNIVQQNISWQDIINYFKEIKPDIKQLPTHQAWFNELSSKINNQHPFYPFLQHFQYGMDSAYSPVDNASTRKFLPDIPIIPMTKADVILTIQSLESKDEN